MQAEFLLQGSGRGEGMVDVWECFIPPSPGAAAASHTLSLAQLQDPAWAGLVDGEWEQLFSHLFFSWN